jgi:hypothetical protein
MPPLIWIEGLAVRSLIRAEGVRGKLELGQNPVFGRSRGAAFPVDEVSVRYRSFMRLEPMNVKQAVLIMTLVVILWIPMTTFLVLYSQAYSPRHIALIGLANIFVSVSLLVAVYRRWISKVR